MAQDTVVKQLEAALAQIDALKAEISKGTAMLAEALATIETLTAAIASEKEISAKASEAVKASLADLAKAQDEHAATKAELEKAKAALASPQYLDAMAGGLKKDQATEDGGTAPTGDEPDILEQFAAIKEPKAKRAFYLKNEAAIKAALKVAQKG